jgi:hypothetical protein
MAVLLTNATCFTGESFVLPDPDGQEVLLVVLVATFVDGGGGQLRAAGAQRPVRTSDQHSGEPGASSVRYEAELALEKQRVDILLNATAWSPAGGQPARSVPVAMRFGSLQKHLVVHGDRRRWAGMLATAPQPFERMPIIYERAFGGTNAKPGILRKQADLRNTVGVGFHGAASASPEVLSEYPNVEYPGKADVPAGFGAIARGWKPRIDFAGTYDQAWIDQRAPLLPTDFNPLHNQAAPEDQQLPSVEGGEPVELVNLTSDGRWAFRLPRLDVPVLLRFQDRQERPALRVDTVLIEPDDRRVTLTARLKVPLARGPGALREVALGHMKNSWMRARQMDKTYIDRRGDRGGDPRKANFIS